MHLSLLDNKSVKGIDLPDMVCLGYLVCEERVKSITGPALVMRAFWMDCIGSVAGKLHLGPYL
jgi:hypothetical protein